MRSKRIKKTGLSARKQHRQKKPVTPQQVITRFAGCGRCSFFLSDIRLTRDPAFFEEAVTNIDYNWLVLPMDSSLRILIQKTFGVRLDIDAFFVEGCCPECRRAYICNLDIDGEPPEFRIII